MAEYFNLLNKNKYNPEEKEWYINRMTAFIVLKLIEYHSEFIYSLDAVLIVSLHLAVIFSYFQGYFLV